MSAGSFVTRRWNPGDVPFLWDMLLVSIHVRDGDTAPERSILDLPEIAHYIAGFGRPGDDAAIAEAPTGERIGAAWCRRLSSDDPRYGFVADDVPELGIAVVPEWRGRGVGSALIERLLVGHQEMSLSVDAENRSQSLYARLGFDVVDEQGTALTMLRRTDPGRPSRSGARPS